MIKASRFLGLFQRSSIGRFVLQLCLPALFTMGACASQESTTEPDFEAERRAGALIIDSGTDGATTTPSPLQQLQAQYVDLRFGMFLHFGILTYTGSWAQANLPIDQFNPTNLNPGQWADAAVSAKMKFGVLTARHHDGFALWPSQASNFNVGHISWRNGQGDVVREYVDAFRARGLGAGLYYSIWDSTQGIGNTNTITAAQLQYVKTQLTELLTNYGPIPVLVLDGWAWKMGHQRVAYQQIRDLVKSLQPNCLISDQTGVADQWEADLTVFEEPKGVWSPSGNTLAAHQQQKINSSGGNDWFWSPTIGSYMTVTQIVNEHLKVLEPLYTNLVLNTPPNRQGLLDSAVVTRLAEVGAAWTPNLARAALPAQPRIVEYPYTPVSATATSGTAYNAIDGVNDVGNHTLWKTSGAFPQSVTADLGAIHTDVGVLTVLPPYGSSSATTTGNITSWSILVSQTGSSYTQVASGTWPANARSHAVVFGPTAARWVRFQVNGANSTFGQLTDLTIGANKTGTGGTTGTGGSTGSGGSIGTGGAGGAGGSASSDPAQYNFEAGTQGWVGNGAPITGVSSSTTRAFAGAHALAVTFGGSSTGSQVVTVNAPSTPAGRTVTFRVWFPSGSGLSSIQPFVQQGSAGNWAWTGTWRATSSLTANAWNTITVMVPSNAVTPLLEAGVQFTTSTSWSGTAYLDSVAW